MINCEKVAEMSWTSSEQDVNKLWTNCEHVMLEWTSHEQVVEKLWNCEVVNNSKEIMNKFWKKSWANNKSWTSSEQVMNNREVQEVKKVQFKNSSLLFAIPSYLSSHQKEH